MRGAASGRMAHGSLIRALCTKLNTCAKRVRDRSQKAIWLTGLMRRPRPSNTDVSGGRGADHVDGLCFERHGTPKFMETVASDQGPQISAQHPFGIVSQLLCAAKFQIRHVGDLFNFGIQLFLLLNFVWRRQWRPTAHVRISVFFGLFTSSPFGPRSLIRRPLSKGFTSNAGNR